MNFGHLYLWFWLLFPLAAAMTFGHLYIRSPNGQTPWKKSPPGSKTPCLGRTEKPQNCTSKMPNVTSETERKCDAFGSLLLLLVLGWEHTMEKITSRQQNTMPLKDGEVPKLHLENA